MRTKLQNVTIALTALFTLLLPLKCGSLILPGVPQAWPDGVIDWLVTAPPAVFFVLTSAVLLMLALAAFGGPRFAPRSAPGALAVLWSLLPPVGALGLVKASSLEPGVIELCYFAGLSAYAGLLAILFSHRGERCRELFLNAACAGVLITAAIGVHQYFRGFDDLRRFVLEEEARSGVEFPADFKARIWDKRTYATFTFASALAGCLLLLGPVTVFRLREWGKRFEPQKLSQWLFAGGGGAMLLGVFLSTKGRGAFLAGLIALGGWSFLQLRRRRWKLLAVGAVLLAAAAGGAYIHYAGRGFGSMTERVGYWITSASMTAEEPLTGSGWGDFTHHHARGKFMGNTELARDPHNMIASFAAAAGVPGLLYSLLLLGLPLVTAARRFRATDLEGKLLAGGLFAFSLHTLMDLDMQVPGLMALMILTQFLVVTGRTAAEAPAGRSARWAGAVSGVLIALLALTGGLRWNRAEMALDALLNASGQAVGNINTAPAAPARVRQLVKEAAAAAPCSPGPYMAGGNYMLKIGDLRQAERDFLEAQKRAPEYWLIFQRLSEVAARRGDAEQAEKLHREAVNRFPLYFKLKGEDKKP